MILQLFARIVLEIRFPSNKEFMDHFTAIDRSRHRAWSLDTNERGHGLRYPLLVSALAVRSGHVLDDDIANVTE